MNDAELSEKIARALKKADMLKMPEYKKGWGLNKYLVKMVAEEIDKELEGKQ